MLPLTPSTLRRHIGAGLTHIQIADLYDITPRRVAHLAQAHGITTTAVLGRRRSGRVTKLPDADFIALLLECRMSEVEVAEMYSATDRGVRRALQRGGYVRGEDGRWQLDGRRCVQCRAVFKSKGPANVVCQACKQEFV